MKDNRSYAEIAEERRQEILDKLQEILKGNNDFWFSLVTTDVSTENQNYRDPYVKIGCHRITGDTHAEFRLNYKDEYLTLIPESHHWPEREVDDVPNRFTAKTLTLKKLEDWLFHIFLMDEAYKQEQSAKQVKKDAAKTLFDSLEGDHKYDQNLRHFVVERLGLGLLIDRETGNVQLQVPYGTEAVLKLFRAVKSSASLNDIQEVFKCERGPHNGLQKLIEGGF